MAGKRGAARGVEQQVLDVIARADHPLTVREVVARTGRSPTAVKKWLDGCLAARRVRVTYRGRGGAARYYLPRTESDA